MRHGIWGSACHHPPTSLEHRVLAGLVLRCGAIRRLWHVGCDVCFLCTVRIWICALVEETKVLQDPGDQQLGVTPFATS